MIIFSVVFCACDSKPSMEDWLESPYTDGDFGKNGVLMEMAYETCGQNDGIISYTLTNTGLEPVMFDDIFSLEYFKDEIWRTVSIVSGEAGPNEIRTLSGRQMCRVDINTSLFGGKLPEGRYRIVRMAGSTLVKAEFNISSHRIDAQEMDFDYLPLAALPAGYDAVDGKRDGCYVIAEDGPLNQDTVQRFADKVSLNVPAKLRTIMLSEAGGTLIRDIVFDLSPDGHKRFFVITDNSRATDYLAEPISTYSYMSIAKVGQKNKVCLSNYVSYLKDAPAGAARELISPEAADNIDLIATVELRIEENLASLPYKFLIYGSDGVSFAAITQEGSSFGCKSGNIEKTDISFENADIKFTGAKWLNETCLSLSCVINNDRNFQAVYDLETGRLESV